MNVIKLFNQGSSLPWSKNLKNEIKWVILDDTPVIGDIMDHVGMVQGLMMPQTLTMWDEHAWEKTWSTYHHRISAAGICAKEGEVVGWKSEGFGVKTPAHLQQELSGILKETIVNETRWF